MNGWSVGSAECGVSDEVENPAVSTRHFLGWVPAVPPEPGREIWSRGRKREAPAAIEAPLKG